MNLSRKFSDAKQSTTVQEKTAEVNPDMASTSKQMVPKKGILKSSSHGTFPRQNIPEQNANGQFLEFKQSSDRFTTSRSTTKIPKLTLTWSEKNAVTFYADTSEETNTETDDIQIPVIASASDQHTSSPEPSSSIRINAANMLFKEGRKISHEKWKTERQTAILYDDEENQDKKMMKNEEEDEEDEEEKPEVKVYQNGDNELVEIDADDSNTTEQSNADIGNSHISGKWWFGRSTKNIPHCAKWGCTHNHHDKESTDNGDKYLTPMQQRFKEIHQLKKQLKLALSQLESRDTSLNELRKQLHDLNGSMKNKDRKNQLQLTKSSEEYEKEKQELINKHEIRVRQLIQEAVDARAEIVKHQMALKKEESKVNVNDAEVMTDAIDDNSLYSPVPLPMSFSFPPSPQVEYNTEIRLAQIPPQDLPLQLQAYGKEAMAWRLKAAQLEMVLKDHILKTQQGINFDLEKCRNENEQLRTYIKNMEIDRSNSVTNDSVYQTNLNPVSQTITIDCNSENCEKRRKHLMDENQRLLEKIEEDKLRLNEYEKNINQSNNVIHSMEEEKKKNILKIEQISNEIEEKIAEVEASNIAIARLQSEVETKTKAIGYLEERHQIYRNTILDNNLVIKDESTEDWKRGFSDPRYIVNVSKRVQTDLTQEVNEANFVRISTKLKELKDEFLSKENNMLEHFQEVEKDLLVKSFLVISLTNQLDEANRKASQSSDLHKKEKAAYQKKLYELGQIVENIPMLKFEIEKLQQERSLMENKLQNAKEEYEVELDMAMGESLKKFHKQSNYWAEKMSAINANNESLREENISLKRSLEELKLRSQVEMADMSKRLTSCISHVSYLKTQEGNLFEKFQLNRNTRDVQVDCHPRVVSKYVACRPNARNKMTDIEKGDLFDEAEERLKLCQGELTATRRQVSMLQQKMLDSIQTQVNDRSLHIRDCPLVNKTLATNGSHGQELESYENEKQKLKERIAVLEKVEEERDKLLKLLKNKVTLEGSFIQSNSSTYKQTALNGKIDGMKKWMSAPQLLQVSTLTESQCAMITSREKNSITPFMKRSSKCSTSQVATINNNGNMSSSSDFNKHVPGFDLATDLMQVQENLDNFINKVNLITNKVKNNGCLQNVQPRQSKRRSLSSSSKSELENLKTALKKSQEKQTTLKKQLNRMTNNFQEVCRELNLYKHEPREAALKQSHNIRLPRSRSFAETGRATIDLDEHLRWKEKAGTMFRELNRIRTEYDSCDNERRELRMQVTMLEGELDLAQCQITELSSQQPQKQSKSTSYCSAMNANSMSSSAISKKNKIKSRLLQGRPFDDECLDTTDSSSAMMFTACTSLSSLNDVMYSASEPELDSTEFENVCDCDFGNLLPARCLQFRRSSLGCIEKIGIKSDERKAIIKKNSFDLLRSELENSSNEKQNVRNKKKLKNAEKQIVKMKKEKAKLTNENFLRQSQNKNDETMKESQKISQMDKSRKKISEIIRSYYV